MPDCLWVGLRPTPRRQPRHRTAPPPDRRAERGACSDAYFEVTGIGDDAPKEGVCDKTITAPGHAFQIDKGWRRLFDLTERCVKAACQRIRQYTIGR